MGRFETELLANNDNLAALANLSGIWIDRVHDRNPPKPIVLDMDSSVRPMASRRARPITAISLAPAITRLDPIRGSRLFNRFGDLERCALSPGNVHSAVRLQLHALAYNLGSFMRTLASPDAVERWSLTTLCEKLIKIGA